MADNKYLKPMLDNGSPRVFNCNVVSQKLQAQDSNVKLFFHNKPLNTTILIKDTATDTDRYGGPSVGTKLYFPFNMENVYEGGRTIFLHDRMLEKAIIEQYGEGALDKTTFPVDLRMLQILDRLPSLDPFLMKDAFMRERMEINPAYFTINEEVWNDIEAFMLLRFEPLVKAAFPDAMASDDKARQLINTIWEARDLDALMPLIEGFRLPKHEALDIFASWKGIVYYSYHYNKDKEKLIELLKWVASCAATTAGVAPADAKEMKELTNLVTAQFKKEWQTIEGIIRKYEDGYDKMFKHKTGSADFLAFLRSSNKIYWEIGNSIGKTGQAIYCWKVMTARFAGKKVAWEQMQSIMRILAKIFEPDKKMAAAASW